MKLSDKGRQWLARLEGGMHLMVYDDGGGYPTIGIGHLCYSWDDFTGGITEEEGWSLFDRDAEWVEKEIEIVDTALTQQQHDALFSFIFNVGGSTWKHTLSYSWLVEGRMNYVPIGFFEVTKSAGKRLPGLANRRLAEFKMWHWGDDR